MPEAANPSYQPIILDLEEVVMEGLVACFGEKFNNLKLIRVLYIYPSNKFIFVNANIFV